LSAGLSPIPGKLRLKQSKLVFVGKFGIANHSTWFESSSRPRYVQLPMKIAVMPGDGVGKEVVPEGLKVLKQAARQFGFTYSTTDYPFGGEYYLQTKQTLPDSALKELAAHDAILFGAVGVDPRGSAQIPQGILETEILLKMRFELDQYINLRPTKLLPGVPTPLKNATPADIDMVIVRENTEGLYAGNGGFLYKNTPHEVANQIEVTTRHGVERCIRYAFEYAKQFNRKKVILVAKTNVLRFAHNLWLRAFEQVKAEYPAIQTDYHHVDACTMYLVTRPQIYDVIVTTNMFGDIITDLGAAIQGGMGMAASGNLNPSRQAASMFEPVHGSAPDIAGKNWANPIATFLSVAMMLDFLGQNRAARAIQNACQEVVADKKHHTRDLGGTANTTDVGDAVCAKLKS
jgi:3-isopropylmalate dehydrogenase